MQFQSCSLYQIICIFIWCIHFALAADDSADPLEEGALDFWNGLYFTPEQAQFQLHCLEPALRESGSFWIDFHSRHGIDIAFRDYKGTGVTFSPLFSGMLQVISTLNDFIAINKVDDADPATDEIILFYHANLKLRCPRVHDFESRPLRLTTFENRFLVVDPAACWQVPHWRVDYSLLQDVNDFLLRRYAPPPPQSP